MAPGIPIGSGGSFGNLAEVYVSIHIHSRDMEREMRHAGRSITGRFAMFGATAGKLFYKGFRTALLAGLAGLTIAGGLAGFTASVASDAEELQSLFNVVFGEMAGEVEEFAQDMSRRVNRGVGEIKANLAAFQDLFVPFGFDRKSAAELSMVLTELTSDLASFKNFADADVAGRLQSALVGNHEAVRLLGISITQENLGVKLKELFDTDVKKASATEKAMARLQIIIESSADAMGDAELTAHSFQNQMRGLRGATMDLIVAIGNRFKPIFAELIGFLRSSVVLVRDNVGLFDGLSQSLLNVTKGGLKAFNDIMRVTMEMLDEASVALSGLHVPEALETLFMAMADATRNPEAFSQFVSELKKLFDSLSEFAQRFAAEVALDLRDTMGEVMDEMADRFVNRIKGASWSGAKKAGDFFAKGALPTKGIIDFFVGAGMKAGKSVKDSNPEGNPAEKKGAFARAFESGEAGAVRDAFSGIIEGAKREAERLNAGKKSAEQVAAEQKANADARAAKKDEILGRIGAIGDTISGKKFREFQDSMKSRFLLWKRKPEEAGDVLGDIGGDLFRFYKDLGDVTYRATRERLIREPKEARTNMGGIESLNSFIQGRLKDDGRKEERQALKSIVKASEETAKVIGGVLPNLAESIAKSIPKVFTEKKD